jgi:benzodiazapine receptor
MGKINTKRKMMNKKIVFPILILLATLAVIAFNGLAVNLPLNGIDTGEISDMFDVYFVPAGYVFSIWGLIYLALLAFSIYQLLPAQRENPQIQRIKVLYIISSIANIGWLFAWHYLVFAVSLVIMLVLLVTLILIYLNLGTGRSKVAWTETLFLRIPFSLYLGWISVATIANVTDVLYYYQWGGWGINPMVWAMIMLIVGGVLAAVMTFSRRDIVYNLVFIWAYIGIAVKQAGAYPVVITSLAVAAGILLLTIVSPFLRRLAPSKAVQV